MERASDGLSFVHVTILIMEAFPKVSVVISTFNRAERLRITLENISEQQYPNLEIVIVDDCSSDHTPEIIKGFRSGKLRVKAIRNQHNLGLATSLNKGIEEAEGIYIARIDDHDLWTDPKKLIRQIEVLEAHPEIGVVGTSFELKGRIHRLPVSDLAIRKQILFRCPICHVSTVFRRAIWKQVGGYDTSLAYAEDWDLWLRMGTLSKFKNLQEASIKLGIEESTLGNRFFIRQSSIVKGFLRKYGKLYPRRLRATLYHSGVRIFFRIFSLGSLPHRLAQRLFFKTFEKRGSG